jgi:hypothetical protein
MFKVSVKNKNEKLEDKVNNPIYIDLDNIKEKNIKNVEFYKNPWDYIRDYVSKSSNKFVSLYKSDISEESNLDFFAKKHSNIGLEFLVIPERVMDKDSKYNMIKKENFPYIRSDDFINKLENIKLNEKGIEKYKFSNGENKYLAARTKHRTYFISKQDLEDFARSRMNFLKQIIPKNDYEDNATKYLNLIQDDKIQTAEYLGL